MEIGTTSVLNVLGPNLVGVSWTSSSLTQEAALLVSTTASSVQIHSVEDQRVVCSWLTRPGSGTRFTVATVQHRLWRRLCAVQDGRRLLSWHEREATLEQALRTTLRADVFALRVSRHVPALVAVYQDGGVSVFNDRHKELFSAPGVAEGGRATWARLTSLPSHPHTCVLMVVTQAPHSSQAAAAGGGARRSQGPLLPPPLPARLHPQRQHHPSAASRPAAPWRQRRSCCPPAGARRAAAPRGHALPARPCSPRHPQPHHPSQRGCSHPAQAPGAAGPGLEHWGVCHAAVHAGGAVVHHCAKGGAGQTPALCGAPS